VVKTTRRNFLKGLLATAAAVAVAPIAKAEQGPQVESTALEMVLPEPETGLREAYEACKHGSLMRLDNLGLSLNSLDRATLNTGLKYGSRRESAGRLMLDTFDQWTGERGIAAADAAPYRDAIAGEYGLRREQWAGWSQNVDLSGPIEITITGTYGEGADAAFAALSAEIASAQKGKLVMKLGPPDIVIPVDYVEIDNGNLTIEFVVRNYPLGLIDNPT
jgi:hypothetical protein